METNLYCSPFAIVFFSGMLYLSKILIALNETLNSRELKKKIEFVFLLSTPTFKDMTIDK